MRRSAVLAAGLLMAGTLVSSAAPANAAATCTAVRASIKLDAGLYYPVVKVQTDVTFSFVVGQCSGSGILYTASCGNSSGEVTINGLQASISTAGGVVAISGEANGAGVAEPDVANGESCLGGAGADVFLFTGVVNA